MSAASGGGRRRARRPRSNRERGAPGTSPSGAEVASPAPPDVASAVAESLPSGLPRSEGLAARVLRSETLLPAIVLPLAFVFLARYASPDIGLVDSSELALAAACGGVAHPPGTPLYLILSRTFLLATGALSGFVVDPAAPAEGVARGREIARAMNLFSALCGAVAASGFAFAALGVARLAASRVRRRDEEVGAPVLAAICATSAWLVARNPWGWSGVAEVYSLNSALLAWSWGLTLHWARSVGEDANVRERTEDGFGGRARGRGALAAAILLAALGLANHHATALLAWPPLLATIALVAPRMPLRPRFWVVAGGSVALSLALYAQLFLAAARDPVLGWGGIGGFGAEGAARLVAHVAGWQYRLQAGGAGGETARVAWSIARGLAFDVSPLALPLLLAGALVAGKARLPRSGTLSRDPSPSRDSMPSSRALVVVPALATIAANLVLSLLYVAGPEDRSAYDLPAHFAVGLLLAGALTGILARLRDAHRAGPALATAILVPVLLAAGFARHAPDCDRRDDRAARRLVLDALGPLPPGAVVFTSEWNLYAPWLFLRHVEGFRPDLRVLDVLLMRRFWYVDHVARAAPELVAAAPDEFASFREQVRRFDTGLPYDDAEIARAYAELMAKWAAAGIASGGAWIDYPTLASRDERVWLARFGQVPRGMLVALHEPSHGGLSAPIPPPEGPDRAAELARMRGRFARAEARGPLPRAFDPSDRSVREWKAYRFYREAAEGTLLATLLERGPEAMNAVAREYAGWLPDADAAREGALARAGRVRP